MAVAVRVMVAPPEVNPLWLPYVRVEDPVVTAERAVALGSVGGINTSANIIPGLFATLINVFNQGDLFE